MSDRGLGKRLLAAILRARAWPVFSLSVAEAASAVVYAANGLRARSVARSCSRVSQPMRIEFGETRKRLAGWLTVDVGLGADLCLDVRRRLPFPDSCVDQIYTSHLLEHLHFSEINNFLRECRRVLKSGAPISVAVPDAAPYLDAYVRYASAVELQQRCVFPIAELRRSPLDYVNYIAYMGGDHKHMFDERELMAVLSSVGFRKVRARSFEPGLDSPERRLGTIYATGVK